MMKSVAQLQGKNINVDAIDDYCAAFAAAQQETCGHGPYTSNIIRVHSTLAQRLYSIKCKLIFDCHAIHKLQ